MGNRITRGEEICDSKGNVIFIVLNRCVVPEGYFVDPQSIDNVRFYRRRNKHVKNAPIYIYYRNRSFSQAIRATRRQVLLAEQNIKKKQ
uniref:Uncharacterized protein n=1 Tax=viral metagenome TaxID=1070528 RepID=A0A6C0JTI3_9ZZZZ